ncbi:MAG TPA: YihY/virulence factor BrkB family protein [Cryomorphaceae bacterium]|nr:YihY/virulence factor BrkB family protein [Cryomorphaceae bacterium]
MRSRISEWFEEKKRQIIGSVSVRKTKIALKRIILPGFGGLSLFQVLQFFLMGLQQGRITNRASAVCFRFILAIPPLLIVFLTLIPFIPIDNFQESIMTYLDRAMPGDTFSLVENTLDDLVNKKQETLISVSFLLTLFFSSNAVQALLDGFSHSYNLDKKHGIVLQYARSFGLLLVFSLTIVLGVILITVSGPVFSYLQDLDVIGGDVVVFFLELAKWILVIILFEIAISVLYRAGHSGKWRAINAGASFATLGLIIVSSLFAWYVNNFGNYNKLYGSVGTVLVVMLWLYLNTIVLLLGFEINAGIEKAKGKKIEEIEADQILKN